MTKLNPPPASATNTGVLDINDSIRSPNGYHAFLVATVELHDPGKGNSVDLQFTNGLILRATVVADVLRLGNLTGFWRTTLHFRTSEDGLLEPPLMLKRLRPLRDKQDIPLAFWSLAGQVEMVNEKKSCATFRVFTARKRLEFFVITVRCSDDQIAVLRDSPQKTWLVTGMLEDNSLQAQEIKPITLRWPRNP